MDQSNSLRQAVSVLTMCLIFWGAGYVSQKFEYRGLVCAPRWLQYLCVVPRRDGRLSPVGTALQLWAYSIPLLLFATRVWAPQDLRLILFWSASVGVVAVITILMRVLL